MKYFLASFTLQDGEHEHRDAVLISAESEKAAETFAEKLAHDTDCDTDCQVCENTIAGQPDHPFSFGDGQTASRFRGLTKLTAAQFNMLDKIMRLTDYTL